MTQSKSIVLTHSSPDFEKHLQPPISLNPTHRHEIALIRLDMYNSIPNIDRKNNCIAYEYQDSSVHNISSTSEYTKYIISLLIVWRVMRKHYTFRFCHFLKKKY